MADKQRRTRFNTGSFKTRDENGEKYISGYLTATTKFIPIGQNPLQVQRLTVNLMAMLDV